MTPAIDGARSGLRLAEAKVATAANNTANQLTEDFRRQEATGVEATSGVAVNISEAARSGPDPVADVVSTKQGEVLYRANLQIIKAEDDRLGATLDLLG